MLPEDGGNGPAPNIVAQVRERALDAGIAPIAILRRHAHHELPNLGDRPWPAWPAALMTVVLSGDEMAMPGEQGVRAHDGFDLPEHARPTRFAVAATECAGRR